MLSLSACIPCELLADALALRDVRRCGSCGMYVIACPGHDVSRSGRIGRHETIELSVMDVLALTTWVITVSSPMRTHRTRNSRYIDHCKRPASNFKEHFQPACAFLSCMRYSHNVVTPAAGDPPPPEVSHRLTALCAAPIPLQIEPSLSSILCR